MADAVKLSGVDVAEFTEVINSCKGDVYMVTPYGDKLNLKSKLCQLIGFTRLIEGGKLAEATLVCEDPEDESKLFRYNLFGKEGMNK